MVALRITDKSFGRERSVTVLRQDVHCIAERHIGRSLEKVLIFAILLIRSGR